MVGKWCPDCQILISEGQRQECELGALFLVWNLWGPGEAGGWMVMIQKIKHHYIILFVNAWLSFEISGMRFGNLFIFFKNKERVRLVSF